MQTQIKQLITKLSEENAQRAIKMNDKTTTEYGHTVLVHTYNNTLDIIKQLQEILNPI